MKTDKTDKMKKKRRRNRVKIGRAKWLRPENISTMQIACFLYYRGWKLVKINTILGVGGRSLKRYSEKIHDKKHKLFLTPAQKRSLSYLLFSK